MAVEKQGLWGSESVISRYQSYLNKIFNTAKMRLCFVSLLLVLGVFGLASYLGLIGNFNNFSNRPSVATKTGEGPLDQPTWLITTSSAANARQRREIIRSTWQTYYAHTSFDAVFVISEPAEEWLPVIQQENRTYGDIWTISGHKDDYEYANTFKTFETLVYLRKQAAETGKTWTFVSKIDDDAFLNAAKFHSDFLLPHQRAVRKIFSRPIQYARPHIFPSGQFYTLTWDLARLIADLYENSAHELLAEVMAQDTKKKPKVKRGNLAKRHEDFMIADILLKAGEHFHYVEMDEDQSYDVLTYDLVRNDRNVTEKTINAHRMKTDQQYLYVAAMFDESGYKGIRSNETDWEKRLAESAPPKGGSDDDHHK